MLCLLTLFATALVAIGYFGLFSYLARSTARIIVSACSRSINISIGIFVIAVYSLFFYMLHPPKLTRCVFLIHRAWLALVSFVVTSNSPCYFHHFNYNQQHYHCYRYHPFHFHSSQLLPSASSASFPSVRSRLSWALVAGDFIRANEAVVLTDCM